MFNSSSPTLNCSLLRNLLFCLLLGFSAPLLASKLVLMDAQALQQVKARIKSDNLNEPQKQIVQELLKKADATLSKKDPSVVDKTILPPTKDNHDYLSISRYWWPDAKSKDGLPWIRKDGQTNPDTQTDAVDRPRLGRMISGVKLLALSYYLTDKPQYAEKAASMIRTWFINQETRMNPNLRFAQSIPGKPKPRYFGILDGRMFGEHLLDSITLISNSKYWSEEDNQAINKWLTEYLTWLDESDMGKRGARAGNNHGSWYKFQVAALAYYLDNTPLLEKTINATKQSLSTQFDAQGAQTHEISRTRSFFYSCFNLNALTSTAAVAERAGMPFWNYETQNKRSLQLGIDYLTPVVAQGEPWAHPTKGVKKEYMALALVEAKDKYSKANYNAVFNKVINSENITALNWEILRALLFRHPEYLLSPSEK